MIMTLILLIVCLYVVQIFPCIAYHVAKGTREAEGIVDFIKLTSSPYIIYKWIKGEEL